MNGRVITEAHLRDAGLWLLLVVLSAGVALAAADRLPEWATVTLLLAALVVLWGKWR